MSLFPSFDSIKDQPVESKAPVFNTVESGIKTFTNKVQQIGDMSEEEITDIIVRQHQLLLDYNNFKADSETRSATRKMFRSEKFIRCLIKCIKDGWITLSDHEVICCNKMAYDYIAADGIEKDSVVRDLLVDLSYAVNYRTISILCNIVPAEAARNIAMMYKSSYKENVAIYRLNTYLIRCGLDLKMPKIVEIYSKLFKKMTTMFCETMFEMPELFYTEQNMEVYNEISKSLVYMLDTMPSVNIKKTLTEYAISYSIKGEPPVRFGMMSNMTEGYTRIRATIDNLIEEDGIRVP